MKFFSRQRLYFAQFNLSPLEVVRGSYVFIYIGWTRKNSCRRIQVQESHVALRLYSQDRNTMGLTHKDLPSNP